MLCGSRLLEVLLQGDPVDILVLAHKNRNSGSNYWSGSRSGSGRSLDQTSLKCGSRQPGCQAQIKLADTFGSIGKREAI